MRGSGLPARSPSTWAVTASARGSAPASRRKATAMRRCSSCGPTGTGNGGAFLPTRRRSCSRARAAPGSSAARCRRCPSCCGSPRRLGSAGASSSALASATSSEPRPDAGTKTGGVAARRDSRRDRRAAGPRAPRAGAGRGAGPGFGRAALGRPAAAGARLVGPHGLRPRRPSDHARAERLLADPESRFARAGRRGVPRVRRRSEPRRRAPRRPASAPSGEAGLSGGPWRESTSRASRRATGWPRVSAVTREAFRAERSTAGVSATSRLGQKLASPASASSTSATRTARRR